MLNRERLCELYLDELNSIPDISRLSGLPKSTIRQMLIGFGIPLRSSADGIRCARHKLGSNKGRNFTFSIERKENISIGRRLWSEHNAKGYRLTSHGYYEYTKGEYKERLIHVVVMEYHIGRHIAKNEVVHHINGIKTDNRLENLKLMTKTEHSKFHANEKNGFIQRNKEGRFICH